MKMRYCEMCDTWSRQRAVDCKACGAQTILSDYCDGCDREGRTAGADFGGHHTCGTPCPCLGCSETVPPSGGGQ